MRRDDTLRDPEIFRARLATLRSDTEMDLLPDLMMACGFLLGGGLPGASAAVAVLIERIYPGRARWIWDETGEPA